MLFQARKALYALKGLVKLQAAVRGHLVRKQTAATLRRMHALIAIQVRARAQRIQMAEEAHHVVTCLPSFNKNFTRDDGFKRMYPVSLILCAFKCKIIGPFLQSKQVLRSLKAIS